MGNVPCVCHHILRIASINTVAAILLAFAKRLPASNTIFTLAACAKKPGHANKIPNFYIVHFITQCNNTANTLMSRDQG